MNDRSKKSAKFEFITISDGESLKDPTRQQQARTHAIKNSLQRKRRQLESYCQNFVDQTPALITKRKKSAEEQDEARKRLHKRSATLCIQSFDPFETLAVNADRLTKLLRHGSAQHAGEPVFSVNDATEHQGLRSVFTAGYQDPALASALCLTLVFASNGHVMDEECVLYNTKTIKYLNARLSNPDEAASNVTLGAVLLLVGVEVWLKSNESVHAPTLTTWGTGPSGPARHSSDPSRGDPKATTTMRLAQSTAHSCDQAGNFLVSPSNSSQLIRNLC